MNRRQLVFLGSGLAAGAVAGIVGWAALNPIDTSLVAAGVKEADTPQTGEKPAAAADPRLPAGSRIVLFGDSLCQAASWAVELNGNFGLVYTTLGELNWARTLDPRFSFEIWKQAVDRKLPQVLWDGDNLGVNGTRINRLTDPDELAHLRQLNPEVVLVAFGANDLPIDRTSADFNNRLVKFCDMMVKEDGRRVIVATIRPHSAQTTGMPGYAYPPDDPKWKAHFEINDFILNSLEKKYPPGSVYSWDTAPALADPQSYRGGMYKQGYSYDGVHLTERGAYQSGKSLVSVIDKVIRPGTYFNDDARIDNLLPNGTLESPGFLVGPGFSGQVPSSIVISRTQGEEITANITQEADPEFGGNKMVFTFPPSPNTAVHEFTVAFHADKTVPLTGAGDQFVQLCIPVEISAATNIVGVRSGLASDSYDRFSSGMQWRHGNSSEWHGEAMSGWISAPMIQLATDALGIRCSLAIRIVGGASECRIAVRPKVIARLVPDPRHHSAAATGGAA